MGQSAAPTAGEHIVVHWEPYRALDAWDVNGIEVGDNGWVALGSCHAKGDLETDCPVALTSSDGENWMERAIPHARELVQLHWPARTLDGWIAVGTDIDRLPRPEGQVAWRLWTSPDGSAWDQRGTLELTCCPELDAEPREISVAPNGSLVAWILDDHGTKRGPFVSDDGLAWDLVDQEIFGFETFAIGRIAATSSEVLLGGGPCTGCLRSIWSSDDGRTWTKVAEPGVPQGHVSFASNGATTIATIADCPTYLTCRTDLWASGQDGSWSRRLEGMNSSGFSVVPTNAGFVAVGQWRNEYVQVVSIDGRTWTEVPIDGLAPSIDDEDCGVGVVRAWLDMILMGSSECGWWRGTPEVVPGPGVPPAPATDEPGSIPAIATP